jgi:hypothetical protein
MMRFTARVGLAAVVVTMMSLWHGLASAQQQPSANAIATARQLLELKGAFSGYNGAVPGTIENVKMQLMQNNISYQKDLTEVAAKLKQDMQGRDTEIGNEMARLYATDFTEPELKDLLAFYKSPLGKKVLTQEPQTIGASLQYMKAWGEKFGDEVDGKFHEEMKKRGKPVN